MQKGRPFFRFTSWILLGSAGGLGSLFLGFVVVLLIVLMAAVVLAPYSALTPRSNSSSFSTFVSGGTTPLMVTHEWQGPKNQAVVNAALYVASGLYNGPPDGYDTWYNENKIPDAIAFWQATCPGCSAWVQGNLQCVMLITAAYGLANQQLPFVSNAIDFWTSGQYEGRPGWETLSPTSLPYPGDMIVLNSPFFGGVGHIVVAVDVKVPGPGGQEGYVQFAEANGPGAIVQMPLIQDANGGYSMGMWRHYTVMGYIRHSGVNNEFLV